MWSLLLHALSAYGQFVGPSASFSTVNNGEGAGIIPVSLSSDKQSYFVVLQAGGINFRAALDTASSDLWLFSSACTTAACQNVPKYPLAYHSPSFVSVDNNSTLFNISYADTTQASGYVALESISVSNLTVQNQAFGVVTDSNVSFVDETSGVLGLSFPRLAAISNSVTNSTPFFGSLAQQGLLDYPLFGLSLTWNSSGTLALGAIDGSVVKNVSNIVWHKVVEFSPFAAESNVSSYLHWAIPLDGFSVNGTRLQPSPTYPSAHKNASLALIDVGTPGLYGPFQDVSRLFSLIESSRLVSDGLWAVPCDTNVSMSFSFGAQDLALYPSDYLIGPTEGNPSLCLSWPQALPPSDDGIDWQLGTAFMRTVYTTFSYGINAKEPPMIGFYEIQNSSTTNQSSLATFFSSVSATIATTLPNFPIPTSSYPTPSYALNSSVSAATGGIVSTALAASTYSAVFGKHTNVSAIPTITQMPNLVTFLMTDSSGIVKTTVSSMQQPSITLGVPPGWSSGSTHRVTPLAIIAGLLLTVYIKDIL